MAGQQTVGLDPVAVTALDFPESGAPGGLPADEEVVDGVRHRRLRRVAVPEAEPVDDYITAWAQALRKVVEDERPQIIHVHSGHRGFEAAMVALAVGRDTGVPVVYEVRGFFEGLWTSDADWAEQAEQYRRRHDTERRCMRAAAAVVTLSHSMRDDIVARGVDGDRVHVVPNGVDVARFAPRPKDPELVSRLGLVGRFTIGYVSNLDHWREGQELLVRAARPLAERGVPVAVLLVGDGKRREQLAELVRSEGADDLVTLTGKIPHDQVLDYYALLDTFVIPRADERAARLVTPLKPFEAMAMGVPLVVSDLPALREIVGDGTRGRVFPAGDVDALIEVLTDLYADADGRGRLAGSARDWVVAERQWVHNAERYAAVYRSVLDDR